LLTSIHADCHQMNHRTAASVTIGGGVQLLLDRSREQHRLLRHLGQRIRISPSSSASPSQLIAMKPTSYNLYSLLLAGTAHHK
jgi:hypothetical protein